LNGLGRADCISAEPLLPCLLMLRTQKTALVPSNWVSISDIINPADDRDALRFNHRTKSRYRLEFVGANAIPFALGLRALVASRAKRLPARPPLSSRPRGQDPTLVLASAPVRVASDGLPAAMLRASDCREGRVVTSQRPTSRISPDSPIAIAQRPTSRLPRRPMRLCASASRPRPRPQLTKTADVMALTHTAVLLELR
jgi:hypothetical protein